MARMGAAHLAPQGGGYEPQRKFDFELQLYGVPGQEVIKLAVEKFTPPGATNEVIELPYLNEVVKVAGQGKWDNAEVVVRDMVDQPVFSSLMAWKKLVQDPETGNIGLASTYKKSGDLVLIGPDGADEKHYQMIGLWPSVVKGEQLDAAGGTTVFTIAMTLSCDKAIPQF
jgi:hypothetical protein